MGSLKTLLKKDLLEIKRSKQWIVFIALFVFIAILSVVTAKVLPILFDLLLEDNAFAGIISYEPTIADSYLQLASNFGEIGLLFVLIIFSSVLLKEKNSGTYNTLKMNGVKEWKIVLSHLITKLFLVTVSYVSCIIVFVSLNLAIFKEYAGIRGVVSLFYLYLTLVFGIFMSIFISSVCKKRSSACILSIVVYFVLLVLSAFPYIDIYNPLYSITLASNIITEADYVISDYVYNFISTVVMIVGFAIASVYIFKNKINNRK